ncbi:hypothetical protein HDU82_001343, partial [Entophlyctis luteolus]
MLFHLEAANIPLVLSAKCRVAPPLRVVAALPHTYAVVPDNIAELLDYYDFTAEEAARRDAARVLEETERRRAIIRGVREETEARRRSEMARVAPGLDAVLVPVPATVPMSAG